MENVVSILSDEFIPIKNKKWKLAQRVIVEVIVFILQLFTLIGFSYINEVLEIKDCKACIGITSFGIFIFVIMVIVLRYVSLKDKEIRYLIFEESNDCYLDIQRKYFFFGFPNIEIMILIVLINLLFQGLGIATYYYFNKVIVFNICTWGMGIITLMIIVLILSLLGGIIICIYQLIK